MTKQITLKELLELVTVGQNAYGEWCIGDVHGDVGGYVKGDVGGSVLGNVGGIVDGDVLGNVNGSVLGGVKGTINGREWQYVETPKDKLKRLIEEGANKKRLLEAFNQLEDK